MRRTAAALVALLTVTAMLFAAPGAAFAQEETATPTATPESSEDGDASVSPGERLSAVIGVEEAELDGEIDGRAFGLRVASAASDEELAEVVAEEYNETNATTQELERRKAALEQARANGSMDEGEYQARMTVLTAQAENAERQANATANASEGLPAELLAEKGINASTIQRLKENAANLSGPEVADIARNIAGGGEDRAGDRGEDRRSDDANQSERGENRTDAQDGSQNQTERPESHDGSQNQTDRADANQTDSDSARAGSDGGH